jgi:hypothetical protein
VATPRSRSPTQQQQFQQQQQQAAAEAAMAAMTASVGGGGDGGSGSMSELLKAMNLEGQGLEGLTEGMDLQQLQGLAQGLLKRVGSGNGSNKNNSSGKGGGGEDDDDQEVQKQLVDLLKSFTTTTAASSSSSTSSSSSSSPSLLPPNPFSLPSNNGGGSGGGSGGGIGVGSGTGLASLPSEYKLVDDLMEKLLTDHKQSSRGGTLDALALLLSDSKEARVYFRTGPKKVRQTNCIDSCF